MGLFSRSNSGVRYGAVIDVGSGSVLVSIVRSDEAKAHPEVIWSKREFVLLKESVTLEQSARNILTTLVNSILTLGNEGLKALFAAAPRAEVTHLQMSICAPWSYTISKTVSFTDDEPFTITRSLIADLTEAAKKKTVEELKENEITELLGLRIIARTTTDIIANGYRSESPFGQEVQQLSLAHVSAVAQQDLIETLEETKTKILPKARVEKYSFMLVYFCVMRELYPSATEFCLVDVTYEATEVCIVRDGILRFSTHVPYGTYSIARELAAALGTPRADAFSLIKSAGEEESLARLPEKQRAAYDAVMSRYEAAVAELFTQTGDALSIPKTIFLHGGLSMEMFFKKHVSAAAQTATKGSHIVHEVTSELLTKHYAPDERKRLTSGADDTALLISAQFFHKQHHCERFEQL